MHHLNFGSCFSSWTGRSSRKELDLEMSTFFRRWEPRIILKISSQDSYFENKQIILNYVNPRLLGQEYQLC